MTLPLWILKRLSDSNKLRAADSEDVFAPADLSGAALFGESWTEPSEQPAFEYGPRLGGPADVGDPTLVGTVLQAGEYIFVAHRTSTWGGTTGIFSDLKSARGFVQAACGSHVLRQAQSTLSDGTLMTSYFNDLY
jgi:O-succinylbenzoate synthase